MSGTNLLAGPDVRGGAESYEAHRGRLGTLPQVGSQLIDVLQQSDLRGRGGAAFPVATKWRSVAAGRRRPVVLVNGAEGEPLSRKDRALMECRPHLVLDGALLARQAINATEVVLYVGSEHSRALNALTRALTERTVAERKRIRMVAAPTGYVSGEESAAVHFVNDGIALPTALPPRPYERGISDRPTLVQNVETLAHVAMIARYGADWFRGLGRDAAAGTVLLTVAGAAPTPVLIEAPQGVSLADAVAAAGGIRGINSPLLLGGYFGAWVTAEESAGVLLDAAALPSRGLSLGCGVVAMLTPNSCGVVETARIMAYLAQSSARQCGPCVFSLRGIASATGRIAGGTGSDGDLDQVTRWSQQLVGRGACRHPDGAAALMASALRVFADDFAHHAGHRGCRVGSPLSAS